MSNPLFNTLGGGMPQGNGPMQMIQQFMQFKQNYKGNPKEEVQKMLEKHASNIAKNSGGEYKVSVAPTRAIAIVTGDDGNNSLLRAM